MATQNNVIVTNCNNHEKIKDLTKRLDNIENNNSEFKDGLNDEWLTYGGDKNNTRYVNGNIIRSVNISSINVQKISKQLPLNVSRQTYHPVFDKTHLYSVLIGNNSHPAVGISFDGDNAILKKIDRESGNVINFRTFTDIFNLLEKNKNLKNGRSPPELIGNFVYISTSGINPGDLMAIAKLNKSDLSTVWIKQIKDVKSEKNYYVSRNIRVFNPTNGKYASKTLVIANYAVTPQYGNTYNTNNYILNYEWFLNQGGCICYLDNGNSVEQLWEMKFGPKLLKKGDIIDSNSFPPNKTSMKITYPIVYVKGSNVNGVLDPNFVYDSSNIVRNDGVKGFKIDASIAGSLSFDLLTDDLSNIKKANIPFTLKDGDIIWNDVNSLYTANDGVTKIPGNHIFVGQAVYKTINLGHVIQDNFEALNLNYYGVGSYGTMTLDDKTNILYIPTSNGQKQPYQDGLDIGLDNTLAQAATNYTLALKLYTDAIKTGNKNDIVNALNNYNNVYKKYLDALTIRNNTSKSPRANRFLSSGLIAANIDDGKLLWFDTSSYYDPFTWSQDYDPASISLIMGDNGDNVVGATIVNKVVSSYDISKNPIYVRRLITSDKGAYHITYNPDVNVSNAISGNSLNNYENGFNINLPNGLIINKIPVGIAGPQGGSFWGASCDGNLYISHQVNIPFGSSLLRSNLFLNENLLQNFPNILIGGNSNSLIGYISNKVVLNDQANIFDIDGTNKLILSQNGYLVATDCLNGNIRWICPLSSTLEAAQPTADIFRTVPTITDGGPVTIVRDVAIVGMASGKLHFVNVNNGKLLKTIAFAEGSASGVCASRDTIYFQGGWRKWFAADTPMTNNMKFLTLNGF